MTLYERIEEFIKNFTTRNNKEDDEYAGTMITQFTKGYCYHFAKILEVVFPGGEVCMCYPLGHFIYKIDNICYDIEGVYIPEEHEINYLIPESFPLMKEIIKFSFLHVDYSDEMNKSKINYLHSDKIIESLGILYTVYLKIQKNKNGNIDGFFYNP